jgi:hypothetical protein
MGLGLRKYLTGQTHNGLSMGKKKKSQLWAEIGMSFR